MFCWGASGKGETSTFSSNSVGIGQTNTFSSVSAVEGQAGTFSSYSAFRGQANTFSSGFFGVKSPWAAPGSLWVEAIILLRGPAVP